jgi:hypothetical protein
LEEGANLQFFGVFGRNEMLDVSRIWKVS